MPTPRSLAVVESNSSISRTEAPVDDTVFPREIYATAEQQYVMRGSRESMEFLPMIQHELGNLRDGRRIAIYQLKEIKQLKINHELV